MAEPGLGRSWQGAARTVVVLVAGYVIATAASLLALIVILAVLPATYFRDGAPMAPRRGRAASAAIRVARNALGVALIAVGVLLSLPLVPGQGVLTILIGVLLVDFPGKRRLELRLVARPHVLETMNLVRAWLRRPPLVR